MAGAHRLLAEAVEEAVFISDLDGRVLYANEALKRLTGYTAGDFRLSHEDCPFVHREDAARLARFVGEFLRSGTETSEPIENRFVDRWGQTHWYRSVLNRVRFEDRDALQFVTQQIERGDGPSPTLDPLREYRILVQNAGDGIAKLDGRGRFLFFNDRFREIVGRDAVELGRSVLADLVHPERRGDAERFLAPGRFETELVDGAGAVVAVEVVVSPLTPGTEVMALVRDVTEQRRLQRELHTREKLDGLGLLASGVAHDLNNFLSVVRTNTMLAEAAEAEAKPVKSYLQEIRQACGKAASLCTHLLAAAGTAPVRRARVELGPMVEDIVSLIRPSIPHTISLVWRTEPRIHVSGDEASLQPVVMNLVKNGAEAIGDRPGRIEIEVGAIEHTADSLARVEPAGLLSPGRAAYIRVADDGVGMDASTRARMFDPFFTTKASGHGLGLTSVLGTVRAHGGAIRVDTAKGAGTIITVYLPLAQGIAVTDAGASGMAADRRLVLVADDEPALRRSLTLMLTSTGFSTLEATDGLEAVELVRGRQDIDVVLLDASMPLMGGLEAAAHIRALRAELPIIMMSGYRHDPPDGVEMVTKPFEPDALVELLRRAVGSSAPGP